MQFLDQVDMPVTVQRQVRSFFGMSSTPCRGADADSHGPSVQKIIEILHMQYIDKVIDVCCAGPRCALSVGDSRDPTVAARFLSDQVVDIPVVSTTGAGIEVQKTVTVPQLQHIRQGGRHPCWRSSSTSYGRPVIMQRRQVSCWRCLRFCSSPELVYIQLCSRDWYSTWRLWRRWEGVFRRL